MNKHHSYAPPAAISSRRHLLISGTGRAGTSFLVRYLTGLGLDTHLSRRGANATWDDDANAGLEDLPVASDANRLPYVIKSPWLAFHPEALGADVTLDAIIVPMRGLAEAATSRVLNERRALQKTQPWMRDLDLSWDVWGGAPGGVVYSLDPLDQARLLAVAFHTIVHYAVSRDIPLVLLDFPRLVEDGAYLQDRLAPVLGPAVRREQALEVHGRLVDRSKLRTEGELAVARDGGADPGGLRFPASGTLARLAARRDDAGADEDPRLAAAEARAAEAADRLRKMEASPASRLAALPARLAGWLHR